MSSLNALVEAVADVLKSADPNIGTVLVGAPRLNTLADTEKLTVRLVAAGELCDRSEVGKPSLRFWSVTGHSETEPLTNGTTQYRHSVSAQGFFPYVDALANDQALARAADLAVAALSSEEWGRLAVGDSCMGFLTDVPRTVAPVAVAKIGETEIHGYAVTCEVVVYEEVIR